MYAPVSFNSNVPNTTSAPILVNEPQKVEVVQTNTITNTQKVEETDNRFTNYVANKN